MTLEGLLASLFTERELRRFIRSLPYGSQLYSDLPGHSTSLNSLAFAAKELLERHGLINTDLFARLTKWRRVRRADIDQVRQYVLSKAPAAMMPDRLLSPSGGGKPPAIGLCNVPRGSQYFVGRDAELDQLEQALRQASFACVAASIEGLTGIGKTELAIQLVNRLHKQNAFPGGIYWFNAENPDLTTTWGQVVADKLDIVDGPLAERAALTVKTLVRCDAPLLIVLDNVESWSSEHRPSPLPQGPHVHLLITTCHHNLGGSQLKRVAVGFLRRPFALGLLNDLSGRDLTHAPGIDHLLAYLGGHALAVELAGVYLCEFPSETPASYMASVAKNTSVAANVAEQTCYERTVDQAFMAIWEQLADTARNAWQLAACFAPEPASYSLATAVGLDKAALRILRRWHLISDVQQGEQWAMHRLTREFGTRIGSHPDRVHIRRQFIEACAGYADAMDEHLGFKIYGLDRAHLDMALNLAPSVLAGSPEIVAEFQNDIARMMRAQGELGPARELFQQALASALITYGPEHPTVGIRRNNLALVLQDLGELEPARELFQQALESVLTTYGPEHPNVGILRNNLARVLQYLGELEPARELFQQALESALANLSPEHSNVAIRRNNLALVLQDLGELEPARELLQQALEFTLITYGPEHPNVGILRNNLARVLKDLGELEPARELLQHALEVAMTTFGPEHPNVARIQDNLAGVLKDLGELEPARELLQQAQKSALARFGPDHPEVAKRRNNLARVLKDLGELEPARELLQLSLESALATFGPKHPNVARIQDNLAGVLKDLGELEPARELLQQALESTLAAFGPNHPEVAKRRNNLAKVLQYLGELDSARELLKQALGSALATFGPEHPTVARIRNNLAMVFKDLGAFEPARELLQQALESALATFGPEHPEVAKRRNNLARVLHYLGELNPARALCQQALKSALATFGSKHPTVARIQHNLARILEDLGELESARQLYQLALESMLETLGPKHPNIARIQNKLDVLR